MEIEYKGANGVVITTKKATIVIDPKLSAVGLKDIAVKDAVEIVTDESMKVEASQKIIFDGPGEYEVGDVSIRGIAVSRHIDADDAKKATMYAIDSGEVRMGVIGNARANLSEAQLEQLGTVDILVLPVGGGGFTLDAIEAIALVKQIDPKVVIPIHYADSAIKYEVPQGELEAFTKDLGAPIETVSKYKIKNGIVPESLTVVEVTRTS